MRKLLEVIQFLLAVIEEWHKSVRSCEMRPFQTFRPKLEILEGRLTPAAYTVNALTDTGAGLGNSGDLRYCITQANASADLSSTITFSNTTTGTVTLNSALPSSGRNLTITGPTGSYTDLEITRSSAAGTPNFRIFNLSGTSTISGMTLSGGNMMGDGGAIASFGGTLTINNDYIAGNTASGDGGAIWIGVGGSVTIQQSTIAFNTAGGNGGGVAAAPLTTVEIQYDSSLVDNTAVNGGALSSVGATVYCTDNTQILNNTASGKGGGVYSIGSSSFNMNSGDIVNNTAGGVGGGIYMDNSTNYLTGVYISNDQGTIGGGFYINNGSLTLDACTETFCIATTGNGPAGAFTANTTSLTFSNGTTLSDPIYFDPNP
jgi:hypothetical protein